MSKSLVDFLKNHPFWAIFIIVFMILPIVGAVIHILLKAFGRRGLDNTPIMPEEPQESSNGAPSKDDEETPPDSNHKT